jgi:voltage-gated potassium channel
MYSLTVRRMLSALTMLALVVLVGGTVLWWLSGRSYTLPQTWFFALISVTTVGYGELPDMDVHPGVRVVTSALIIAGVGAIAFFQSTLTAMLVEGVIGKAFRRRRMQNRIESLEGHVIVAGCGRTGRYVVEELIGSEKPFVVIDRDAELLESLGEQLGNKLLYIIGDATHDATLEQAAISHASGVIAALTDDRDNLFVTLTARSFNPKARIVSKVSEAENEPKVRKAGADKTVSPQHMGGMRLVNEVLRPQVTAFLDDMLRITNHLRFEQVGLPEASRYVGKTLREVPIRHRTNLLVVALHEPTGEYVYNPGPDHVLGPGSELIVMGDPRDVDKLRTLIQGS